MRKVIVIDTAKYTFYEADSDYKRIDGMYMKVNGELLPAAYIFPIQNKEQVIEQLDNLKNAKKHYDDLVADVYYKIFPKLR